MISRKDRKIVASELASLRDKLGRITPDGVLGEAKKKTSALHKFFEWDDGRAAHQHRLNQARHLIRSVRVQIETTDRVVSCVGYVRDPDAAPNQGYIETARLKTDREKALEVIQEELRRARSAIGRARDLSRVVEMEEVLNDLLEDLDGVVLRVPAA